MEKRAVKAICDMAGGDKNLYVINSELFRKQRLCSSNIAVCFIEVAVVFD